MTDSDKKVVSFEEHQAVLKELEETRHQLEFMKAMIDELPTPVFAKNADARFVFFNKAYENLFNVTRDKLLGLTVKDLTYLEPDVREKYHGEDLYAINQGMVLHYETQYDTSNGHVDSLYWSKGFKVPESQEKGLIGTIVDISLQKQLEKQLSEKLKELEEAYRQLDILSRTDPLTKLSNRRTFNERLTEYISLSTRHDNPMCFMVFDLDKFKSVNDRFGHLQGDLVLKEFAQVLSANSRHEDISARFGGEEFVLLLPFTNLEEAKNVAERIREETQRKIILPNGEHVTVSIGLVQYQHYDSQEQLFDRADKALYQSKENGRNQVTIGT